MGRLKQLVFLSLMIFLVHSPLSAQGLKTYRNPVISDVGPADPMILNVDGVYHLYATGSKNYPYWTSPDMVNWTKKTGVFAGAFDLLWAPDMIRHTDSNYYLYFTGAEPWYGIGVASSSSPSGPFVNRNVSLGSMDANMFVDTDGKLYLYHGGGKIMVRKMKDPLTSDGGDIDLFTPTQDWEKVSYPQVEGAWMLKHNNTYYLMYSGCGASGPSYAVGYATSSSPTGPFTKYSGNPIIRRTDFDNVYGPGHHSTIMDSNGVHWVVYHQKHTSAFDGLWNRYLCIDPMWFDSSGIIHCRPTRGIDRPAPGTVVWPQKDAYESVFFGAHDGCHPSILLANHSTGTYAGRTLASSYITFRNVNFGAAGANGVEIKLATSVAPLNQLAGTVDIMIGGVNGTKLVSHQVKGTGSSSPWQTQEQDFATAITGTHDLVFVFRPLNEAAPLGNFLSFRFKQANTSTIQQLGSAQKALSKQARLQYSPGARAIQVSRATHNGETAIFTMRGQKIHDRKNLTQSTR